MNNFEQLMLAAQVRQIAVEMRDNARAIQSAKAARNVATSFNPNEWNESHPVEAFVPMAIAALMDVSAIISRQPQAK